MNAHRLVIIVVTLSLIVVAALTMRTALVTSAVVSSGRDLSDYALRHPSAVIPISAPDQADYALRHPELTHPAAPDLSDWYLRHRAEFGQ